MHSQNIARTVVLKARAEDGESVDMSPGRESRFVDAATKFYDQDTRPGDMSTTELVLVATLISAVFGAEFGDLILGLPVTLVTIVKLIFGTMIGYWALNTLRELESSHDFGNAD